MWVSRPGLGLETDQDHFLRFLGLDPAGHGLGLGLPGLGLGLGLGLSGLGLGLGGWS